MEEMGRLEKEKLISHNGLNIFTWKYLKNVTFYSFES